MESHNGFSNGVNGTADITVVEHSTTLEVKPIQKEVPQAGFVEISANIGTQKSENVSEIAQPEIQQTVVEQPANVSIAVEQPEVQLQKAVGEDNSIVGTQQTGLIDTAPKEVATLAVDTSPQPALSAVTQAASPKEINGGSGIIADASPQPQVKLGEPELTREVKDIPATKSETNVTKLPGNMPGTSDFEVPSYAINALNRIAQTEGFTNYLINYERGSNFGDGFVAEIVKATIKGSQLIKGVQEDSQLVLVLKLPPENKARRETMGMNVFEREVTAYNEILPMFQKFQSDKGLKPGQGFVSFPKCYYASFDKEKDEAVIIMEDIRKKGFKMLNKYKTVDYPHAKAILETVAQFHGLSLAMKDQCPGVFDKYKGLKDAFAEGMVNDMMKTMTIASCQKAAEALEPHEEILKQKLLAFGENIIDIVKSCTNGELAEPYAVLNHGDCWINNMMFKYQVCSHHIFLTLIFFD